MAYYGFLMRAFTDKTRAILKSVLDIISEGPL